MSKSELKIFKLSICYLFQKDVDKLKTKLQMNIYACINKDGFSVAKKENGSTELNLAVREI